MTVCEQDHEMLAAYLDGEIPSDRAAMLEEHLRTCTACAAEVANLLSVRRTMRVARTRFTPSADFRRKIQSQVAPRRPGFRVFGSLSLAVAALAMLVLVIFWMRQGTVRADAYREVADLHVGDLASVNPYDVISSDRHTVKPWFQGRIPFAFNLPDFAGTEFTLLGGRLIYLHQQPAAQVVVGMGQHKISVLIVKEPAGLPGASLFSGGADVHDSFNVQTWTSHGLRFFVIGDAEKAGIQRLAQALQSANQ